MAVDVERDRLKSFLYHLGKGLWKSIPVVGPIIEEVVYEQFKESLDGAIENVSDEQVQLLLTQYSPLISRIENAEAHLGSISDDLRIEVVPRLVQVLHELSSLDGSIERTFKRFQSEWRLDLESVIAAIRDSLDDKEHLIQLIDSLEERRHTWINRISENQRRLLESIPFEKTPLHCLWSVCNRLIPECGYKEFRFRLHELEWLSLISRQRSDSEDGEWLYWRVA